MRDTPSPRRRRLGPLSVLDFAAPPGSPVIACLHGYGADASDLAPFASGLRLAGPARWVFPDAPLGMAGPFGGGRAWFPIDQATLMRLRLDGKPLDFPGALPEGAKEALAAVLGMLEALAEPWDRLIIGGFSQGAVLAMEAALRGPSRPLGLFILSGTLVDEAGLRARARARAGLAFFQSHGAQDELLAFAGARRLHEVLTGAGLAGTLLEFEGGHGIPPEAAEGLAGYLDGRLAAAGAARDV